MPVRIYKPSRNAMQSGKAKYDHWIVEYVPACTFVITGPKVTSTVGWHRAGPRSQRPSLRRRVARS